MYLSAYTILLFHESYHHIAGIQSHIQIGKTSLHMQLLTKQKKTNKGNQTQCIMSASKLEFQMLISTIVTQFCCHIIKCRIYSCNVLQQVGKVLGDDFLVKLNSNIYLHYRSLIKVTFLFMQETVP